MKSLTRFDDTSFILVIIFFNLISGVVHSHTHTCSTSQPDCSTLTQDAPAPQPSPTLRPARPRTSCRTPRSRKELLPPSTERRKLFNRRFVTEEARSSPQNYYSVFPSPLSSSLMSKPALAYRERGRRRLGEVSWKATRLASADLLCLPEGHH